MIQSPFPRGSFISFQNDSSEPRGDFDLRRSRDLRQGTAFTLRQGAPTSRLDHGTWWWRVDGHRGNAGHLLRHLCKLRSTAKKGRQECEYRIPSVFMEFVDDWNVRTTCFWLNTSEVNRDGATPPKKQNSEYKKRMVGWISEILHMGPF